MRLLALIAILAASAAHGASVGTAKFGDIGMDDNVVTNVDLAPYCTLAAASNLVANATPGDYESVSNKTTAIERDGAVWLFNGEAYYAGNSEYAKALKDAYGNTLSFLLPPPPANAGRPAVCTSGGQTRPLAFLSEVADAATAATNYTDAAIADIDIPDPDLSGYATTQAVAGVSASLSALWTYTLGGTVWFAVTNYMRTIRGTVPSLQLWEVRDGATNLVYHSSEEITNTVAALWRDLAASVPSPAWSRYQSGSGEENPDPTNTTVVSTPQVMLTGGGEWTKHVLTGGSAIWVFQTRGVNTVGGGTDGTFLNVLDDEGNAQFEVSRTDSYEVDAVPDSCVYDSANAAFTVRYAHDGGTPPTLYASTNLLAGSFTSEDENHEINPLGIGVTWTQGADYWEAALTMDAPYPRLFVHAKALQPGQVTIKNNAPVSFEGGILYSNKVYRPVVNGTKLEFTEAP